MATPSATSSAAPSYRTDPFIASVGDLVYLWGGQGDSKPESIFIYHEKTETWTEKRTKGQRPPPYLRNGACCIADNHFYIYGGFARSSRYGALFQLNVGNWSWKKLSDCFPGGPGKKNGCRLVAYEHNLLVVGGDYGKGPSYTQAGSSYDEYGKTNEVHCYNLTTGKVYHWDFHGVCS